MRLIWRGRDVGSLDDSEEEIADRMMAIDKDAAMHAAAYNVVECDFHYDFAYDLVTGSYMNASPRDWVSWAVYEAQVRLRDRPDSDWNDFETRMEWNDKEEQE